MLESTPTAKGRSDEMAREVWRTMFDLLIRSAPARTKSLARRGLTPSDSRALFSLEAQTGRSMRSLADEWNCDPSYATSIVDRLESLGLATRQVVSHDRRIKLVVLTRKGEKTRSELLHEFHQPPAEFAILDRADLEALGRVLAKLSSTRTAPLTVRR
jgi:DNA-binding MarR family transcriptional regulator